MIQPTSPNEWPQLARVGLWVIWLNMGLTASGVWAFLVSWQTGNDLGMIWCAYAALFVGVPLFLLPLLLSPAGLFALRQPVRAGVRRYRRYFLLNLLGVLLWLNLPWLLLTVESFHSA